MKRILPLLALIGFLTYTAVYIVVYLFRAFRIGEPVSGEVVQIWHGDPFLRAILVSILFLIGLVVLIGYLEVIRVGFRSGRGVRVRSDLRAWLAERSEATGETPGEIADRAISIYRERMEATKN